MSYARFLAGHGVYVCGDVEDGKLWCYGCRLIGGPGHHFSATKRSTMVAHLNKHAARRHRLRREDGARMTTPQNEDAKIREDAATFAIRAARVMAIGAGPPNVISIVCACGMVATARKATGHTDQDGARTLARRLVTLIAPGSE